MALGLALTPAIAQEPNSAPPAGGRGGLAPSRTLAEQMLAQGDRNSDHQLSSAEFSALAETWFDSLDPDRTGRVRREDFLQRFAAVLPPAAAATGRPGSPGPTITGTSVALGLFAAADLNSDAVLDHGELKSSFAAWFEVWDADKDGALDQAEVLRGLNSILPRTNFGVTTGRESIEAVPGLPAPPPSPPLAPAASMAAIRLADGFKLELAASEPMIEDPVALSFDADGRAYVVEMRSFMRDIDRTGEREPIGRITRLEDTDGDGRFDRATVFVDRLIVPRAVAAVAGGVLYVSDYQLYFARDAAGDGRAEPPELIDADYGRGNIEHAANALFPAMDNWIYSGESSYRYRLVRGTVIRQPTEFRGQWGMTQDNYGRLIYNVNNSQLMGDFAPPNYLGRNPHHLSSAGLNLFIATDQRVFPLRMNTAINRGYAADVLDPEGRAYVFASSCGPVVYRGDNFPAEFVGNAFVCDPALNLIKRNLVFEGDLTLTAKFAYADREFLASTDERFRPSTLYNGPDGALWLVDMYRGITQHGQFMTPYLRRETLARRLDQGIHYGRLYRISSVAKPPAPFPKLARESTAALIRQLSSANGWIRDTAQRLLVERGDRSVVPALARLVAGAGEPLGRIHALWTLEGLFAALPSPTTPASGSVRLLNAEANFALEARDLPTEVFEVCLKAIADPHPKIQVAAMRVADALAARNSARQHSLLQTLARLEPAASDETLFQIALTTGSLAQPDALPFLGRIATRATEHLLIREAVMSGLQDCELQFLQLLLADPQWTAQQPGRSTLLQSLASAIIKERQPAKIDTLLTLAATQRPDQDWRKRSLLKGIAANAQVRPLRPIALERAPAALDAQAKADDPKNREQGEKIKVLFTWPGSTTADVTPPPSARPATPRDEALLAEGKALFLQICAACHGPAGQGLKPSAPPLVNSEWVLGPDSRLIRIALGGMSGPLKVAGNVYEPPNILPEMPPLAALEDRSIAAVLSYVRSEWGHDAPPVAPARVAAIRAETENRQQAWNEQQLLEIK
ncbi:MAG: c-type cytochrome [Opitutaceae bacterium]